MHVTSQLGAARPATFHLHAGASMLQLKQAIGENMRVLVSEQRLLVGSSADQLSDAMVLGELRAQLGEPVRITLVVAPVGLLVLSGGLGPSSHGCLWDVEGGEMLQELADCTDTMLCNSVDWVGQQMLLGGWEPSLRLWDMVHSKTAQELVGHTECGVFCVAADWAVKRALSGGQDCMLRLWDLMSCRNIQTLIGHTHPIFCVVFDWSSQRALSGAQDRSIRYWSLERGETVKTLRGHSGTVMCIAADWAWQRALSGSWDCSLRLWDLTCGETVMELRAHTNAVVSVHMDLPQQRAISGSADNLICVWELTQGTVLRQLCGHVDVVTSVDADWATQRAVSGSKDGTLRLWDLDSGDSQVLQGHLDEVRCATARWQAPHGAGTAARPRSKTLPR